MEPHAHNLQSYYCYCLSIAAIVDHVTSGNHMGLSSELQFLPQGRVQYDPLERGGGLQVEDHAPPSIIKRQNPFWIV
jgi:hypothetical protein